MKNSTKILIGVVVVALVGAGVYFGNTKLQKGSFQKFSKINQNIKIANIPPDPPTNFKVDFYDKGAKFPWDTFPKNKSKRYYGTTGVTAELKWNAPQFTGLGTGQLAKYRFVVKYTCKYPICDEKDQAQISETTETWASTLLIPYSTYDFELYAIGSDGKWSQPVVLTKQTLSKKLPIFPNESVADYKKAEISFPDGFGNQTVSKVYKANIKYPSANGNDSAITGYRISVQCLTTEDGTPCNPYTLCYPIGIFNEKKQLVGMDSCNSGTAEVEKNINSFTLLNLKEDWAYIAAVYPLNKYGEGPPLLIPYWKVSNDGAIYFK